MVARMGKRRGGGGDYEDQYGGGWSGGHRDFGGEFRGGHGGGGGGTGGGDAGGGKPGSGVTYQRQLPKFLQQHSHLLGTKQEVAQQREEFSQLTEKLSKYGDEDDVASAARRGLGSHDTPAVNHKADAMSKAFGISAEDEEQKRLSHEEKAKGNRAFSEKRYEDAVKHFTLCMKLDPKKSGILFEPFGCTPSVEGEFKLSGLKSTSLLTFALLSQDFELALADGRSAVKLDAEWAKGWVRVGAASLALHRYTDARESYERALALDEGNEQISKYIKEAKEAEESSLAAGKFVFHSSKRKRKTDDSSSAVPAGKRVQDKKLLSFDDDA